MHISQAARELGATHLGADVAFRGVGTDTRSLERGELFVALRGPRFDGHDFLDLAQRNGAAGVMVETDHGAPLPALAVEDTQHALLRLAGVWRDRHTLPVVAITGSNGKTTVKEMLAAIFRESGAVLATRGNLNNHIGVPLTLMRLGREHRVAVIEIGANHRGEIARLGSVVRPGVGLITLCSPAHLEGFGSVEDVARAKGELIESLSVDGTAVINADDRFAELWLQLAGARRCITFGLQQSAHITATWHRAGAFNDIDIHTPTAEVRVRLSLAGRHNVQNALAATAAAVAVGVDLDTIARGLGAVRPLPGRLIRRHAIRGASLLDDTYNASPASLAAALDVLASEGGTRWLVLGDMAELGDSAERYHREAGALARESGVERLFTFGRMSEYTGESFAGETAHYQTQTHLIEDLKQQLTSGVTLLVKGSRSMKMESVVQALCDGA